MKTTVDIPESLLKQAMRNTKARTKKAAILRALEEMNRRHAMAALIKHSGTCDQFMSFDELMQLRSSDAPLPPSRKRTRGR
jgi:Bacterial antitoxin of type II TA system, VapB